MVYLTTAALLIFGYAAVAQDPDCDFRQNVGASDRYYIASPDYPNNYSAGRTCRYVATCPEGYNCRVDCNLSMPYSAGCTADRLLISRSGDPTLAGANAYCGARTLSAVSINRDISLGLIVPRNSRGGRFLCELVAQLAPVTPAPTVCRCGERKQNRIVGGQETKVNEYTMMAGLVDVAEETIYCGGVIISSQYIMSAAHCVVKFKQRPSGLVVSVGDHNINNPNSSARYHSIARFIIHENYNPVTFDYDIALVVLQKEIQFNENIQPVCLPFKFTNTNITGSNVTILGWGLTEPGGPKPDGLRKVDVAVISQEQCSTTEANITDRQICTFTPGKDSCQFDSGGPLMLTDSYGSLFSVGIVSNGNECASTRPGIGTRVTTLLRWVVNNANSRFCIKR